MQRKNEHINEVETPISSGYLEDAFAQSILLCHDKCYPWIMNNYFDLCFEDRDHSDNQPLRFYKPDLTHGRSWDTVCPWFDESAIEKENIANLNISLTDYLCEMIQSGRYIYISLDEFYLYCRYPYQEYHYTHVNFIYGYNYEKKIFYGLAYSRFTKHFGKVEFGFSEIEQGFFSDHNGFKSQNRIKAVKLAEDRYFNFNFDHFLSSLSYFIESYDLRKIYRGFFENAIPSSFGIQAINDTAEYFYKGADLSTIPIKIIEEHLLFMQRRLEYIDTYGYAEVSEENKLAIKNHLSGMAKIRFILIKEFKGNSSGSIDKEVARNYLKTGIINLAEEISRTYKSIYTNLTGNRKAYDEKTFFSEQSPWPLIIHPITLSSDNKFDFSLSFYSEDSYGYLCFGSYSGLSGYQKPLAIGFSVAGTNLDINNNAENINMELELDENKNIQFLLTIKENSVEIKINGNKIYDIDLIDFDTSEFTHFICCSENKGRYKMRINTGIEK